MLCLAFDPMYQLLIKFEQRKLFQNSNMAPVKRAETFDDPLSSESFSGHSVSSPKASIYLQLICLQILSSLLMVLDYPLAGPWP